MFQLLYSIVFILYWFFYVNGNYIDANLQKYEMNKKGIKCTIENPHLLQRFDCRIKAINRSTQVESGFVTFQPNVSINWLRLKYQSYYKFSSVYRKVGVSFEVELCGILNGTVSIPYVEKIKPLLLNFGNFSKGCPFKETIYYQFIGIEPDILVDGLPPGELYLEGTSFAKRNLDEEEETLMSTARVYFEIKYNGVGVGNAEPIF